jgi:hypothetical protein
MGHSAESAPVVWFTLQAMDNSTELTVVLHFRQQQTTWLCTMRVSAKFGYALGNSTEYVFATQRRIWFRPMGHSTEFINRWATVRHFLHIWQQRRIC